MRTKGIEPPQPVMVLDSKSSASQPIAPRPQDLYKLYLWIKPDITFTSKFFVDPKGIEPSTLSLQGRNASLGTCKPNNAFIKCGKLPTTLFLIN